ncbi:hypothetical protein NECAME_04055, partial [Necator americanus]
MLLSPDQFSRLSEYASYSNRRLKDMLPDFQSKGKFHSYLGHDDQGNQTINPQGFKAFLADYFEADLPAELIQQLSRSFSKAPTVERRTSALEKAFTAVRAEISDNLQKLERLAIGTNDLTLDNVCEEDAGELHRRSLTNVETHSHVAPEECIRLKPLICTLSLLEPDTAENKLEVVFHVYDSDGNGFLDKREVDGIIEQMMNVARYQKWDTIELEQILRQMMAELDHDQNGVVSLDEWRKGGLTNIPLLVLLGVDTVNSLYRYKGGLVSVHLHFPIINSVKEMKEDGSHSWKLRHFSKPTYCNACCSLLVGWGGKQGLSCWICKYTVHERCVRGAANNCIRTYSNRLQDKMFHHWQDANATSKCVHHRCMASLAQECNLGVLSYHILPPTHIIPAFLERRTSSFKRRIRGRCLLQGVNPGQHARPLLVFVNPKSGGKQGVRILQKFAYILNPRQVYDLSKSGPEPGLLLFSTVSNCNILVCGGDGTIGWVLESIDKMEDLFEHGRPPVAVLPLGTGNDLARCLQWGGGYENESLNKILFQIEKATMIDMDRWFIKIMPKDKHKKKESGDSQPYHIINNYFSIGVDASIAHRFHAMREKYPEKFNSRMRNKLWYFELGTSETLSSSCKNLHEQIDIHCDGEMIDLGQDSSLEGIALLNIHSIYGGSNLWGRSRKGRTRFNFQFPYMNSNDKMHLQTRVQDIGDGLCDGEMIDLGQDSSLEGIALLNIHSIYGGSNLWGRSRKGRTRFNFQFPHMNSNDKMHLQTRVQDIGDGLVELVGLESAMQMGQIKAGVRSGRRLSQCSAIVIETFKSFPMQIDGEPWMQQPCMIQITHKNQVKNACCTEKTQLVVTFETAIDIRRYLTLTKNNACREQLNKSHIAR